MKLFAPFGIELVATVGHKVHSGTGSGTTKSRRHIEENRRPDVARAVEQLRQIKGWDLADLAAASDISRSILLQVELGTCGIVPALAERLGDVFGIDPDILQELAELDGHWFDPDDPPDD